jgi:RNA polymerase sigma-70 factor, ECF subfamily
MGLRRGMLEAMSDAPVTPEASEHEWVERARSGDRDAFDRLVRAHLPRVWKVVWRVLRHEADTEDVVQETFLAAWRSLANFRGEAAFSTWLHRIAVSRALNHLDRAGERLRRASDPLDAVPDGEAGRTAPAELLAHPDPTPLRALEARERMRRLARCLELLPAPWRAVLALRDGEGMAYEEIASVLGVALGTVRSRLARSRIALKRCVEGESP